MAKNNYMVLNLNLILVYNFTMSMTIDGRSIQMSTLDNIIYI